MSLVEATELAEKRAWTMAQLLKDNNVAWTESADRDPYSFLPGWLHTR